MHQPALLNVLIAVPAGHHDSDRHTLQLGVLSAHACRFDSLKAKLAKSRRSSSHSVNSPTEQTQNRTLEATTRYQTPCRGCALHRSHFK